MESMRLHVCGEHAQRLVGCGSVRPLALAICFLTLCACSTKKPYIPRRSRPPLAASAFTPAPPRLDGPAGLPSVVIAELASPNSEIHFARNGNRGLLLSRSKGQWLAGSVRIDRDDESALQIAAEEHGMVTLGPAPSNGLAALHAHDDGFMLLWVTASAGNDELWSLSIDVDGKARGAAQRVSTSPLPLRWIGLVETKRGPFLLWDVRENKHSKIYAARWSPSTIGKQLALGSALGWHAVATPDGLAVAMVKGTEGATTGTVHLRRIHVDKDAHRTTDHQLSTETTALPDVQLAQLGSSLLASWTDTRGSDPHVYAATSSLKGEVTKDAHPLLSPVGGQALVSLVAAADGQRALLAWEPQLDLPNIKRSIHLEVLGKQAEKLGPRASLAFHGRGLAPHFVADGAGFAVLTLAPMQLVQPPADGVTAGPAAPTFVRLDQTLKVRGAEPVRIAALKSDAAGPHGLPQLVHSLKCEESSCTTLASGPALLVLAKLPLRQSPWLAPVQPLQPPKPPHPHSLRAIAELDEPIADLDAVKLADGRTLVAWVTHFMGERSAPGPAPPGAKLQLRFIGKDGTLGPIKQLSKRAISIGGVALVALPEPKKQRGSKAVAVLGWAGPNAGSSQMFLTRIDGRGKKLKQKTVTMIRRRQKKSTPNEVSDVSLAADGKGQLLCAWSDTRDNDSEIYVARVNSMLQKNIVDRRITRAKGVSGEAQLAVMGKRTLLVWSDARGDKGGKADIFMAQLDTNSLKIVEPATRLHRSRAHSRTPQLAPTTDGVALWWVEEPETHDPDAENSNTHAGLRWVLLDRQGKEQAPARLLRTPGRQLSSATLRCNSQHCRGVATASDGALLVLGSFEASIGGGSPVNMHPLGQLAGGSAQDTAVRSLNATGPVFFLQPRTGGTRVRELRIDW